MTTSNMAKAALGKARHGWHRLQVFVERGTRTAPLEQEETECGHCGLLFSGNYCPRCGQNRNVGKGRPRALKTFREAYPQLSSNFIRTMIHLALRPGYMIRDYLRGHRVIYQNPVGAFLIAISIVALCNGVLDRMARNNAPSKKESFFVQTLNVISYYIQHNDDKTVRKAYGYWHSSSEKDNPSLLVTAWNVVSEKLTSDVTLYLLALFPLLGITSYAVFRKRKFDGRRLTVMEHYVIYAYLYALFSFIPNMDTLQFVYMVWTYRGIYRLQWWKAFGYVALINAIVFAILSVAVFVLILIIIAPAYL